MCVESRSEYHLSIYLYLALSIFLSLSIYLSIYVNIHTHLYVCMYGWMDVHAGRQQTGRSQGGDRAGGQGQQLRGQGLAHGARQAECARPPCSRGIIRSSEFRVADACMPACMFLFVTSVCVYQFIHTHMHAEYIHAHLFTHTHNTPHTQNAPHVEQLVLTSAAGLTGDELEKVSVCLCLCGVCGVCACV